MSSGSPKKRAKGEKLYYERGTNGKGILYGQTGVKARTSKKNIRRSAEIKAKRITGTKKAKFRKGRSF